VIQDKDTEDFYTSNGFLVESPDPYAKVSREVE